jgi:hypothetical protein
VVDSSKAAQGEDLDIEEPVSGRYSSVLHFYATLASVLGATLIGHQVIQMGQPAQKGLLVPIWMMDRVSDLHLSGTAWTKNPTMRTTCDLLPASMVEASTLSRMNRPTVWPLVAGTVETCVTKRLVVMMIGRPVARLALVHPLRRAPTL